MASTVILSSSFLILDRMMETGHYPELGKILGSIIDQQRSYQQEYERRVHNRKSRERAGQSY